jgi:hypothetical protein
MEFAPDGSQGSSRSCALQRLFYNRPGPALDDAVIQAWHSTLEFELRPGEHFATKAEARARVSAWIHEHHHTCRNSALSMTSPADYERVLAAGQAA